MAALISPQFREYERIATTVLNAYLTPELAGYLSRLDKAVGGGRRLAMTSSGGLLPFAVASAQAGRLVLSGPAAGVVAATALGRAKGHQSIISFDMGGTSTDVCRVAGRAVQTTRHSGAGWVNRVPSMPVRTIGAGGGSLAWVDGGGALRVGPMSAGADPGPAAYGRGGDVATVTDANVVLGRIPADLRLGGSIEMEIGAARRALAVLGAELGLEVEEVAAGVIEVVDTHMERALRAVSVEEGVDPQRFGARCLWRRRRPARNPPRPASRNEDDPDPAALRGVLGTGALAGRAEQRRWSNGDAGGRLPSLEDRGRPDIG